MDADAPTETKCDTCNLRKWAIQIELIISVDL